MYDPTFHLFIGFLFLVWLLWTRLIFTKAKKERATDERITNLENTVSGESATTVDINPSGTVLHLVDKPNAVDKYYVLSTPFDINTATEIFHEPEVISSMVKYPDIKE